jgi:membrane carboxypeptidase/penicillin-binding protein PbpC
MTEWFFPGTAPTQGCDWHRGDGVVLPGEYATWAGTGPRAEPEVLGAAREPASEAGPIRIVSPQDGDRYTVPVGIDPRYATVALRASGGNGAPVRWYVDGRAWMEERWRLVPGEHVIRAVAADGRIDTVRIIVH